MTVLAKARELVAEIGVEGAILLFQEKIDSIGEPKNFEEICKLSGFETAIDFINKNLKE